MIVKICGITRREDAEAAAEAGADAIGFIFYKPSPRFVTPEKARELGEGLKVWKVGVFVNEPAEAIQAAMETAELDVAQIYGSEIPKEGRVWRAFRMTGAPGRGAIDDLGVEAVLLDGQASGHQFEWFDMQYWSGRVLIAGGLDAENVGDAIRACHPWGVDASSRLESAPGIKDHDKVRRFIEKAKSC